MKPLQFFFAAFSALCLLLTGPQWPPAAANDEEKPASEALLAEVSGLALAAKLQLHFDQIASLKEFAEEASAAAAKVEKANAESWDKVGDDIWKAIEHTLKGRAVSERTWAKIQREVSSNRRRLGPIVDTLGKALSRALALLSEEQKRTLGIEVEEVLEARPVLPLEKERFQQLVDAVLSVRSLSPDDYHASREELALSLAGKVLGAGQEAGAFAQTLLGLLDSVFGLSEEQFAAARETLPGEIGRYLRIQVEEKRRELPSDQLNEGDFADSLFSPESPAVFEALLKGPAETEEVPPASEEAGEAATTSPGPAEQPVLATSGESEAIPQAAKSWQWERALVALDCLRLATTLSLFPEQMQAMSQLLHNLFQGKLPEDRQQLLESKTNELTNTRDKFWAAYLSRPSSDLIQRAEKLVASLRLLPLDPKATKTTLDQLKRLLTPEQAALIDWGDLSLLPQPPQPIFEPRPLTIAEQQSALDYIFHHLAHARAAVGVPSRGPLPPRPRDFLQPGWRLILPLAESLLQDLAPLRPVSPEEYPPLLAAVQEAMSQAASMGRGEFYATGYQLAASLLEQLGLGPAPPEPPPPPPPLILESEFDSIMLDPASAQVFDLGAGGG